MQINGKLSIQIEIENGPTLAVDIAIDPTTKFHSREGFYELFEREYTKPALFSLYQSMRNKLAADGDWDCEVCSTRMPKACTGELPGGILACPICMEAYGVWKHTMTQK